MLNWPRAGLIVFFMPAVWQVYTGKPTLFLDFLWDDCDYLFSFAFQGAHAIGHRSARCDPAGPGKSARAGHAGSAHDRPLPPIRFWAFAPFLHQNSLPRFVQHYVLMRA
jgi:hypothetical protein